MTYDQLTINCSAGALKRCHRMLREDASAGAAGPFCVLTYFLLLEK